MIARQLRTVIFVLFMPLAANALEVDFERDASLPVVYVNVAFKAGTVNDPVGQVGITDFLGEMLLRGTQSRTKEQIDLELDQLGAQLGAETRAEALILRGGVLESQLEPFLKLLEDIVLRPAFSEREIRKLKADAISRIYEERSRDGSLASRKFGEFLFDGHPYGRPTNGKIKDIENLTRSNLTAHYSMIARKPQLVVVGTGASTPERIRSWTEALASHLPQDNVLADITRPSMPESRRLLFIDKPDRTQTQVLIGQTGSTMTDPDFFPLTVANHAFGGGTFTARLMTEIRVKRGWSYGAYSGFRYGKQPRQWILRYQPALKDTVASLAHVLKMIEEVKAAGISREEFTQTQKSLVNSAAFMSDTPRKRVENVLLERTLDLPPGFFKEYAKGLESVTLESANEAFKRFLMPDRMSIGVLATKGEILKELATASGVSEKSVTRVSATED